MTQPQVLIPQAVPTTDLERQVSDWPEKAKQIQVTDQLSYEGACHALQEVKALRKEVADTFDPIVSKAHAAHKEAVTQRKRHDTPLAEAEQVLKGAVAGYEREQEQLRQLAEQKANAEAQKSEEDDLLRLAEAAEQLGASAEEVEAILTQQSVRPTVVLPKRVEAVSGISTRGNWKAEVTDVKALCKALGAGKASVELVKPNMTALNQLARAQKSTMNVPGARAVCDTVVSSRSA